MHARTAADLLSASEECDVDSRGDTLADHSFSSASNSSSEGEGSGITASSASEQEESGSDGGIAVFLSTFLDEQRMETVMRQTTGVEVTAMRLP